MITAPSTCEGLAATSRRFPQAAARSYLPDYWVFYLEGTWRAQKAPRSQRLLPVPVNRYAWRH